MVQHDDQVNAVTSLHQAEQRLQDAVRSGDVDALDQLLDDRVVYTGPDGSSLTKQQDLEAHRSRALTVEVFEQQDLDVTVAGSTGLTRVLARIQGTAEGRPFTVRFRYTRTWVLAGSAWRVLAAHAGAVADDPSAEAR